MHMFPATIWDGYGDDCWRNIVIVTDDMRVFTKPYGCAHDGANFTLDTVDSCCYSKILP